MDFQNRIGSKTGGGGMVSESQANVDRRERLRRLALETIDLAKDPYFMKNHLGTYECKLCLTLHSNEGSYLAHTQGKKHQSNLGRRAAKEAQNRAIVPTSNVKIVQNRMIVKIGRPGFRATKIRDPVTNQLGLLFHIEYPEIADKVTPLHRFMSAYEQRIEQPDKNYQYLLFAAEPYETIAFKLQSRDVDTSEGRVLAHWDHDEKVFTLQFFFRRHVERSYQDNQAPPPPAPTFNPNPFTAPLPPMPMQM